MRLINLTGHDLTIRDESGTGTLLQSYGRARVESEMGIEHEFEYEGADGKTVSVQVLRVTEQRITGLPEPEDETFYIVSGIVASAAKRGDVVAPSRVKRAEGGRVEECKALLIPVVMGDTRYDGPTDVIELEDTEEETGG